MRKNENRYCPVWTSAALTFFVFPWCFTLSAKQRLFKEFLKRVPLRISFEIKVCFIHLFCACSAGWLDSFNVVFQPVDCHTFFLTMSILCTLQRQLTQNPSVRCSFKESSHGQSFDSLSPNNRQTSLTESHQPLNQVEQKHQILKASCSLEMGLASVVCCFCFCFPF